MITQNFMMELELSLLRSFASASRQQGQQTAEPNFTGAIKLQDYFMKEFMAAFDQKRKILEQEITAGRNRDPTKIVDQIQRLVDAKLRTTLYQKGGKIDEQSFRKAVRELKMEVRTVFYKEVPLGRS